MHKKTKTFPKSKLLSLFEVKNYYKVVSKIKQFRIEGMSEEETLRLAVAFGTAAALTQTAGAVRAEDIDELLKETTVDQIT